MFGKLLDIGAMLGLGPEADFVLRCATNMLIGGALALYIRELYKRFSSSLSNREAFANTFPVLTLIIIMVIFVVKSSLALSLGLVGALSIVRFRAAIKDPEELIYLFFCIAVGLALGADHRLLAVVAVLVISAFILGRRFLSKRSRNQNLLLTLSGDAARFFDGQGTDVMELLRGFTQSLAVQRLDLEDGQVQFRATVVTSTPEDTMALVSQLQAKLPQFQVSYVNLDTLL